MKAIVLFLFAIWASVFSFAGERNQCLASIHSEVEMDSVEIVDSMSVPSLSDVFIVLTSVPAKKELEEKNGNTFD